MTGYGRATSQEMQGLQWSVEIHGVNRKMLDFNIYLPKEMLHFDIPVRQRLSEVVERGQISVRIVLRQSAISWQSSEVYFASLKALKNRWLLLASDLGYPPEAVDLPFLLTRIDQMAIDEMPLDQERLGNQLMATLDQAIAAFLEMKQTEGDRLGQDLKSRLELIEEIVDKIEKEGKGAPTKFYQKLKERILELSKAVDVDEERIMRELAIYAEKADITEEITRLHSHLKQALALFDEKVKGVGRTLEFLTQEMQREISTIGAKSGSLEITNLALAAKAELEKIREQVQNIE